MVDSRARGADREGERGYTLGWGAIETRQRTEGGVGETGQTGSRLQEHHHAWAVCGRMRSRCGGFRAVEHQRSVVM